MSGKSNMQTALDAQNRAMRTNRVEIFTQTLCWYNLFTLAFFWQQAADNMRGWVKNVVERHQKNPALYRSTSNPVIYIEEMDCLRMAKYLTLMYGKNFAVLNFANAHYPGGGVKRGAGAQEENIFRRTDCYDSIPVSDCLSATKDRYTQRMVSLLEAENGVVYIDTQHLRVCTRDEENIGYSNLGYKYLTPSEFFSFIELRAAAVNMGNDEMKMQYAGAKFEVECVRRIEAQFKTLIDNNVRHVVLGAFGCGAFGNRPQIVANAYMTLITKYQKFFDVIAFPIIQSAANLGAFRDSLVAHRLLQHDIFKDLKAHNIDKTTPFITEHLKDWAYSCKAACVAYGIKTRSTTRINTTIAASGPAPTAAAIGSAVQSIRPAVPGSTGNIPKSSDGKRPASAPVVPISPKRAANNGAAGGNASGSASNSAAQLSADAVLVAQPRLPLVSTLGKIIVPMQYLSKLQGPKIMELNLVELKKYISRLPLWVPASEIVTAFKFSQEGINVALLEFHVPFVWAPEFELRRASWAFIEPKIVVNGESFETASKYFKEQQRRCLVDTVNGATRWASVQDRIMQQALKFRFEASQTLTDLLVESYPHKLLCINKDDAYWGWTPSRGGQNKLGVFLTELRSELVRKATPQP